MKKIQTLLVLAIILAGAYSCKKAKLIGEGKVKGTEWSPSVALPLVDSKLTVYDILAAADSNNLIVIDETTGLLALVYEGQLFSFSAQEIIKLPDTTVTETVQLDGTQQSDLSVNGSVSVSSTKTINYQSSVGVSLKSVSLKDGDLSIKINPNYSFTGNATVNITIPGLKKDGVAFNETIVINNFSTSILSQFDLTDYVFDMTNGGVTTNSIPVNFASTITKTSGTVGGSDGMDIDLGLLGLKFSEIHGDFGQQIVSTDRDSILIRVFAATSGGTFNLTDPKILVDITNSFGFPVDVDFTTLETVMYDLNGNATSVVPMQYNNNLAPFNFASILAPSVVGDSITTSLVINSTNSNIITLMEPTPKFVHNQIKVVSNPSSPSGNDNFATDKSILRVTSKVELPLKGYSGGWLLQDTVAFEFGEISFEYLDQVLLRINIDNYFPVNAKLQLIALDANQMFLDSLLTWDNNLISSGITDADGKTISSTNTMTDFVLDEERASSLFKAAYVVIRATAETDEYTGTSSSKVVQIFEDYTMRVRVGVKIDGNVKIL